MPSPSPEAPTVEAQLTPFSRSLRARGRLALAGSMTAAALLAGTLPSVGSAATSAVTPALPIHCEGHFTAIVRSGQDANRLITGGLEVSATSAGKISGVLRYYRKISRVRGKLHGSSPTRLRVTGSVRGRALSLVFHLPSGRTLHGTGHATNAIRMCADLPKVGTLHGPTTGDSGDWDMLLATNHVYVGPGIYVGSVGGIAVYVILS